MDRIRYKAAVNRIRKGRQAVCARNFDVLSRGAQLLVQLNEFRPPYYVSGVELLILRAGRNSEGQVRCVNRPQKVVSDENAHGAGRYFFVRARSFKFVAP